MQALTDCGRSIGSVRGTGSGVLRPLVVQQLGRVLRHAAGLRDAAHCSNSRCLTECVGGGGTRCRAKEQSTAWA